MNQDTLHVGKSRQLSSSTNELLSQLWRQIQTDERIDRDRLRMAARHIGVDAYRAGLRRSDLIVALNESWMTSAGRFRMRDAQRLRGLVDEVIALCIIELSGLSLRVFSRP